ncbi:DUF871 domain-containing protein [Lacticaseibacillus jixiensis]|uniref:DUF871 domain-containing protein n=1 Tax=Lacticaseibacillus jixiensis TaxID=3231926 RepID=UPI0036F297C6
MGKLGVSVYPERSTYEQDAAYLALAAKYGYKRVFTSLLEIKGNKDEVVANFKRVITRANELGMQVMVDINPALFQQLGVKYDDLRFFKDLGAWGVRLDLGFTGAEEAAMTRNPYNIKIEVNMSQGTHYIDNIMAFNPKRDNLLGSHNFYPHRFSGLGQKFFDDATKLFTDHNLNTAAFVNAHSATFGPWPTQDGLCTLEAHRNLPIATQVKHYQLLGTINDVIIGNAYASETELQQAAAAFTADYPSLRVVPEADATDLERELLFENPHSYRGDASEYLLRSTQTRVKYADRDFPAHHTVAIKRGDVLIDNAGYGQYKGETQIALQAMPNDGRVNVVGHVHPEELFLLDYLRPWSGFTMTEAK